MNFIMELLNNRYIDDVDISLHLKYTNSTSNKAKNEFAKLINEHRAYKIASHKLSKILKGAEIQQTPPKERYDMDMTWKNKTYVIENKTCNDHSFNKPFLIDSKKINSMRKKNDNIILVYIAPNLEGMYVISNCKKKLCDYPIVEKKILRESNDKSRGYVVKNLHEIPKQDCKFYQLNESEIEYIKNLTNYII